MRSHTVSRRRRKQSKSNKSVWQKIPRTIGLYRYVPKGTYYAMLPISGRLHRESLKTADLAFAKRKLSMLRAPRAHRSAVRSDDFCAVAGRLLRFELKEVVAL